MSELALKTVMILKEEYADLIDTQARVNAVIAYITGEKFPDVMMICRLLGRQDAVEFLKKKKGGQA